MMASVGATPAVGTGGTEPAARGPVLGLDIGGTKIAAGVVDADGSVLSLPPRAERRPSAGRTTASRGSSSSVVRPSRRRASTRSTPSGSAAAGRSTRRAGVLIAPLHLPGWRNVPVTTLAEQAFEQPALLENDATAAAAAEHRFGAGVGTRNMLYLTISTGVGGGVVLDGRALPRRRRATAASSGTSPSTGTAAAAAAAGGSAASRRTSPARRSPSARTEAGLPGLNRVADSPRRAEEGDPVARSALGRDDRGPRVRTDLDRRTSSSRSSSSSAAASSNTGEQLLGPVRKRVRAAGDDAGGRTTWTSSAPVSVTMSASSALRRSRWTASLPDTPRGRTRRAPRRPCADGCAAPCGRVGRARRSCRRTRADRRVYTFGNGGSAADSLHFAEELVGRFKRERRPLAAQSLAADPTALTCIANDYEYDDVFARQVRAFVRAGTSPSDSRRAAARRTSSALSRRRARPARSRWYSEAARASPPPPLRIMRSSSRRARRHAFRRCMS